MPRQPSQLLPQAASKVDLKAGESPRSTDQLKADLPPERPLTLRPGTKLPNGKRVPPPPPPKGTLIPKGRRRGKREEIPESHAAYHKDLQLRTRSDCERAAARIINWIRTDLVDPNKGNAMLNGVRTILQSKTDTENMQLKVADRELMRRIHEMEETVGILEEAAGA